MHNPGDFTNLLQKQTSRRIKHATTSPKQSESRRLRGVQSQDVDAETPASSLEGDQLGPREAGREEAEFGLNKL